MKSDLIDVHAVAIVENGELQVQVVDSAPEKTNEFAKVVEPIDDARQLVLRVSEGTSGQKAQNLATHLVPALRHS